MSNNIDPAIGELFVQRVQNGWIVRRGRMPWQIRDQLGEMFDDTAHVARTPKELGDLIAEWATRQQDVPK